MSIVDAVAGVGMLIVIVETGRLVEGAVGTIGGLGMVAGFSDIGVGCAVILLKFYLQQTFSFFCHFSLIFFSLSYATNPFFLIKPRLTFNIYPN